MELKMFSIHDFKSEQFLYPFAKQTPGQAERDFRTLVNDSTEGNLVFKYPEDYPLFYVGTYDDNTGKVTPCEPTSVVKAIQLKDQKGPQS